uniref:Uncharacterized protein n=1 Tax=Cyanistes caeruleus TaxID=156563 RepID=A0A8C0UC54_CYACU
MATVMSLLRDTGGFPLVIIGLSPPMAMEMSPLVIIGLSPPTAMEMSPPMTIGLSPSMTMEMSPPMTVGLSPSMTIGIWGRRPCTSPSPPAAGRTTSTWPCAQTCNRNHWDLLGATGSHQA